VISCRHRGESSAIVGWSRASQPSWIDHRLILVLAEEVANATANHEVTAVAFVKAWQCRRPRSFAANPLFGVVGFSSSSPIVSATTTG
jgi:hypothetical protein